jgi:hypothetical protein
MPLGACVLRAERIISALQEVASTSLSSRRGCGRVAGPGPGRARGPAPRRRRPAATSPARDCLPVSACRSNGTPGRSCWKTTRPDPPSLPGAISLGHPLRTRQSLAQCPGPDSDSWRRIAHASHAATPAPAPSMMMPSDQRRSSGSACPNSTASWRRPRPRASRARGTRSRGDRGGGSRTGRRAVLLQ